ncbi:MAG: hypothetical protein ACPHK8_04215 [Thermoplasmatota archaeon]
MKLPLVAALVALAFAGCGAAPDSEPFVHPFPEVYLDGPTNVTVIWAKGGTPPNSNVDWQVEHFGNTALGWLQVQPGDALDGLVVQKAEPGPRYGASYVGVDVTLFAFTDQAEVQASTLNKTATLERVPWEATGFQQLPDAVYYLQEGDAPDGMEKLPGAVRGMAPIAHEALLGMPVGGVVSFRVPEDAWSYGAWVGDLYITAQIDALHQG